MILGDAMRRVWVPTIVVIAIGFLFGALFRYFFNPADEASLANYVRSAFHGVCVGMSGWAVHLYFTLRSAQWVRRWPLVAELLIRSAVMAVVVTTVAVTGEVVIYGHRIERVWLLGDLPKIIGLTFVVSITVGAAYELIRMIGGRTLLNVMLGRYRQPAREERVLLFLDLVGSTTLAEQMGELRVQELLTRFFYDIDEAIVAHGGEVHAYVGDEVIVTWPVAAGRTHRPIDCVFAIEDRIAALAGRYTEAFGLVPNYRAGLHAGSVVISECGDSHRQIAYFGDAMNVTARLQERCKEAGRKLLVSGELLSLFDPGKGLVVEALGPTQLRGRKAAVEMFAVARA
jgi:class 3 adenylate cyclase